MKEMIKSKYMILFIVLMLGVSYFNSLGLAKLNNQTVDPNEITMNK